MSGVHAAAHEPEHPPRPRDTDTVRETSSPGRGREIQTAGVLHAANLARGRPVDAGYLDCLPDDSSYKQRCRGCVYNNIMCILKNYKKNIKYIIYILKNHKNNYI